MGGIVCLFVIFSKMPDNSFAVYIFDWEYRMLRKIRSQFLWGQKRNPPDSYDYFLCNAKSTLRESLLTQKPLVDSFESRARQAEEIASMLQKESFIRHFFSQFDSFSGAVYHCMRRDYRTGDYLKKDYSVEERLRKLLPAPIVANEKAFHDFMKLVYAGWFDKETGMYVLTQDRNRGHIGRAIKLLCNRNGIPVPERVFSGLFHEKESTIKEWIRANKYHKDISDQTDNEINAILR